MTIEMLTYADLGARLHISPEGARSFAKRMQLPRSRSDDGKALVSVDLEEIQHTPRSASVRRLETLQAEVSRLEGAVAAHRADFERERDRADQLMTELLRVTADTMLAKETTARLEGELAALRVRGQANAPHGRLRRLATSVVAADRRGDADEGE